MDQTKQKIIEFNEMLDCLLTQLEPYIGSTYHYQFQQIIKINSTLPIEQFLAYALLKRDKILARDETYFISIDNHLDTLPTNETTLDQILHLRSVYIQLNEDSKSNLWDILQALLCLSEDYLLLNTAKYFGK
jgi:hypothetical protein